LIPFSRSSGFSTSARSTSGRKSGCRSAAIRAAKPAPSGIRTPLFDLLLDPDRRPCYQLAARDVQQQDRDRVDLEQRPRSFEQNRQQVVETQMRKRRIGDQLHTAQPLGVAQVGLAFQGVHDSLGRKPLLSQTVDVVLRADDAKCRSPLMGSAHEGTLTVDRDETS